MSTLQLSTGEGEEVLPVTGVIVDPGAFDDVMIGCTVDVIPEVAIPLVVEVVGP